MEMGCAFRTALVVFLSSVLMSWSEYAHEPWWVRLMAVLLIGYGTFVMAGYAYRGVLHVKHAQHAALWKGRLSRNRMLAMVWTAVALMVTATAIFGIWEARMWPVLFTSVDSTPLLFVAVMLVLVAYWLALLPASPAGKALPPLLLWCALAVQACHGSRACPGPEPWSAQPGFWSVPSRTRCTVTAWSRHGMDSGSRSFCASSSGAVRACRKYSYSRWHCCAAQSHCPTG